jgi:hypothetical protein
MLSLSLALGCGSATKIDRLPTRAGQWWATDLHAHTSVGSNDTDGSTVEDLGVVAQERGLALLVITDHSNAAGSMDCETGDVEDCPNQGPEFPARIAADAASREGFSIAVGVEISPVDSLERTMNPTGHIGCLPGVGDPFRNLDSPITDRPAGSVPGGAGVDWCLEAGGLSVVNHPFSIAGWIAYDWSSQDYDALEVFNGGGRFDANDAQGVDAWLCDLAQGKSTIALGGSDTHRASTQTPPPELLDQALGFPTTWVWSESSDREALLGALGAGRVIVGDPRTQLDLTAHGGGQAVGPGQILEAEAATLTVTVQTAASGLVLQLISIVEDDCTDDPRWTTGEAPSYSPTFLLEQDLIAGQEQVLEIELGAGSTVVARVWPSAAPGWMVDGVAIAAPIRVAD